MSNEYLLERDRKNIAKANELLQDMPYYVKQFYNAKKGSKKELTRLAYIRDIFEFLTYLSGIHHIQVKELPVDILGHLTVQDITEYSNQLYGKYKPASVKRKLASISSFYKFLVLNEHVANNPAAIIDWPAEDKSKKIIYLSADQTSRLLRGMKVNDKQIYYFDDNGDLSVNLKTGGQTNKGKTKNKATKYIVGDISEYTKKRRDAVKTRNYLIALLFLKTGIRVSELVSIDLQDIDRSNYMITITGKGGKTRPVSYYEEAADGGQIIESVLAEYINGERLKALGSADPGETALFLSTRGKRITVRQVESMIKEMVQTYLHGEDFLEKDDFSPHKLRSTCATRLLDQTEDIKGVSDLLGHESIEITSKRYAALSKEKNAKKMGQNNLL